MNYLSCEGDIDLSAFTCSTGWQVVNYQPFDPSTIDPVLMAGAVGAGFFMLVPLWAVSFGIRALISSFNLR